MQPIGRIGILVAALAAGSAGTALAQGQNQIACRVVVERSGDVVNAFAVARVSQQTTASYTLRATKISASGTGATEQQGERDLGSDEMVVLSQLQFRLEKDGWVDFELDVTERLTGTTCDAQETVNQF